MIPLFISDQKLSFERLQSLPRAHLVTLWDGSQSDISISYLLALDPNSLHVIAKFPPNTPCDRAIQGKFTEHLWKGDVFEIFLGQRGKSSYQETHLTPSGEWWSATFSAPRIKEQATPYPEAQAVCISSSSGSQAYLKLVLNITSLDNVIVNVCACLGSEPRWLLSAVPLAGKKAHFHQPEKFIPPITIALS